MHSRHPVRLGARLGVLLASFPFILFSPAFAASTVANYVLHTWQAESGLPQDSVTAVVQSHDGYIWIGTYSALARFDGVHFTIFDTSSTPGLEGSRVTSLFESADGTLWIGEEDGTLMRMVRGRFQRVDFQPGWGDRYIMHLGADDVGDVWAVNRGGFVTRIRDGLTSVPQIPLTMGFVNVALQPRGMWISRNNRIE